MVRKRYALVSGLLLALAVYAAREHRTLPLFWLAALAVVFALLNHHHCRSTLRRATLALEKARDRSRTGDVAGAIDCYLDVLRMDPRCFPACYALGVLHFSRGDFTEALFWFRRASGLRPRSPQVYLSLGLCLARQSRPQEARHMFQRAATLDPKVVFAYGLNSLDAALGDLKPSDLPLSDEAMTVDTHLVEDRLKMAWSSIA